MKVFVTGSDGFLGKHVLAALQEDKSLTIEAPTRDQFDCRDLAQCLARAKGADCILHMAAMLQYHTSAFEVLRDNTAMTMNILEAARQGNVRQVIGIGTILGYAGETPPFRESRIHAQLYAGKPEYTLSKSVLYHGLAALHREHPTINTIYLVLPNMFGEHGAFDPARANFIPTAIVRLLDAAKAGTPSIAFKGQGNSRREFAYVGDVAKIINAVIGKQGSHVLNVGSGDILTPMHIAQEIAKIVGYTGEISFQDPAREDMFADTTNLRALIGPIPHTPFPDALRKTVQWYEQNLGK